MKKKMIITTAAVLLALSMTSIPAGYVHATEQNWNNVIYPGVYIRDIDVSGKDIDQAEKILEEAYEKPILSKKIEIKAGDKVYSLDYGKLDAQYNISEVVKEAFGYGKDENIIKKYKLIKSPERKEYTLSFTYNAKPIDEIVDKIEKDVYKNPVDASISINNGIIKITSEINGARLEKDKLRQSIVKEINDELSVEKIQIEAPVESIQSNITKKKLSAINTPIASFSTSFSTSTANRINNIQLATKSINGTLLMPGETFSFNETVGERTAKRGYRAAGVIIDDKIESGIGGGICQVSSTLYNAMLKANITAQERRPHSLPLTYVGKGLDATVDWGNIDFKFKNTLSTPMYIEGYIKSKKVFFNIYSDKALAKRTYQMVTEIYDTIEPTVVYKDDPNIPEGETEVVKKPSTGYKVKVYRKTYENGKLISTEVVSKDFYKPVKGEIIRGTKKVS